MDNYNLYICVSCEEEWGHYCDDYGVGECPDTCPLCSMPWLQMLGDVYKEEGIIEALRMAIKRIKGSL